MKTNTKYKFLYLLIMCCVLTVNCCNKKGDKFDYNSNAIMISGTDVTPVVKFVVEDTPSQYNITVTTTKKVEEDIDVTLEYDADALEKYNKQNNTSYALCPLPALNIEATIVTIKKGTASSSPVKVSVISTTDLQDGLSYCIPITIKSVSGTTEILEASRTIILRISRPLYFKALDLSMNGAMNNNTNTVYSNFIFPDEKKVTLGTFTYEFKCLINAWNANANNRISRLCSFTAKDESNSSMIRFSENGYPVNSVQWICPGGNIVPPNEFNFAQWYHFALVYNGSKLIMYIDGIKVGEKAYGGTVDFQRFELGMSWENYRSRQQFNGRLSEVRVWNKALTVGQIKSGICGVDPTSNGLVAYWKFNEGEGYVFKDATGNGYDMDWSHTTREVTDGAGLVPVTNAHNSVIWVGDVKNNCSF